MEPRRVWIIGELINASREQVRAALVNKDERVIRALARAQVEAGATVLDLNAGVTHEREVEYLVWLVEVVQDEVGDVRLSLDTSNPKAMEKALSVCKAKAIINSISNEASREEILELAVEADVEVIGLPMGQRGVPRDAQDRLEEARCLLERCAERGITKDRMLIDILCMSVGSDPKQGLAALEAARLIKDELGVRVCGAVSNVSFGLPKRRLLNKAYLAMMVAAGVDAVIMDPTDERLRETLLASEALVGRDRYCLNYIRYFREKGGQC